MYPKNLFFDVTLLYEVSQIIHHLQGITLYFQIIHGWLWLCCFPDGLNKGKSTEENLTHWIILSYKFIKDINVKRVERQRFLIETTVAYLYITFLVSSYIVSVYFLFSIGTNNIEGSNKGETPFILYFFCFFLRKI